MSSPLPARTIWPEETGKGIAIIDQTALPHVLRIASLATLNDVAQAIRVMQVRGAPLIGVTAAYGVALAMAEHADDEALAHAIRTLGETRPTAVNLYWALARMQTCLASLPPSARAETAWAEAGRIAEEDVERVTQRLGSLLSAARGRRPEREPAPTSARRQAAPAPSRPVFDDDLFDQPAERRPTPGPRLGTRR